jgi:membrane fusion protein (multidrug efflux system)
MWESKLNTEEQLEHARFQAEADRYQVESQQHKLENARAELRSLDLELEKTRITAPFDGVVARRYVREGQRVANGDRLFWVTSVAPLLVRFTVPDEFAAALSRGDTVAVSSLLAMAPVHRARVISVSPVVDPVSDSVEVIARVLHAAGDLKPGMTVNISIARNSESR